MPRFHGSAVVAAIGLALSFGQAGCDVQCRSARCVNEEGGAGGVGGTGGTGNGAGNGAGSGGGADCSVQSIVPAGGADDVSVASEIRVVYTTPVLASSLAQGVTLADADGAAVELETALEDDVTLVARPKQALRIWTEYTLTSTGAVTSVGGDPCAGRAQSFSTGGPVPEERPILPAALNGVAFLDGEVLGVSEQYRGIQVYEAAGASVAITDVLLVASSPRGLVPAGDALAFAPAGIGGVLRFQRRPLAVTGELDTPGYTHDVAPFSAGGAHYLALADDVAGLRLVSAGSPGEIEPLSDLGTIAAATGTITSVAASDDGRVIVAGNGSEVLILESETPTVAASFQVSASIPLLNVGVRLEGDRLFVASAGQGLSLWDVAIPGAPEPMGTTCGTGAPCESVSALWTSGDDVFAKIAPRKAARFTVDAASGAVTLASTYDAASPIQGVTASADRVFLATEEGLTVHAREGQSPLPLWEPDSGFGVTWDAVRVGEHVYTASGMLGLLTFEWPRGGPPKRVDQDLTLGTTLDVAGRAIAVAEDRLVLGDGRGGVTMFGLSDPKDPLALGTSYPADIAGRMVIEGDRAYMCNDNQGLRVLDVSATGPAVLGNLQIPGAGACYDVYLSGGALLVVGTSGQQGFFGVADVSVPSAPAWLDTAFFPELQAVRTIAGRKGRLFVTTRAAKPPGEAGALWRLALLSVPADGTPAIEGIDDDLEAAGVTTLGDYLFVAAGHQGLHVFEVGESGPPLLRAALPTAGFALGVRADGDGVLVNEGQGGIERFLTGPLPPAR